MSRFVRQAALAALLACGAGLGPVAAQTPPAPTGTAPAAQTPPATDAEPTPERLELARTMMAKSGADTASIIRSMRVPMVGLMQQMGLTQQDRAEAVVSEALLPLMQEHIQSYVDALARGYASILTVDDLRGAIAFYDTPAGQDLIRAEPQLGRLRIAALTQWLREQTPEIQSRVQVVMQAHGWAPKPQ